MIKRIFIYATVFFSLFFISFYFHENYIIKQGVILPFSLRKVYLFHVGFSFLICVNFQLLSSVDKFYSQLGFIYLGLLFLKLILFAIVFYKSLFSEEILSQMARISLIIPMIIFLLTEAIFVAKILNKRE